MTEFVGSCPKCARMMVAIPFTNDNGKIEVDYIFCEYCGHREVAPPMLMGEWLNVRNRKVSESC
jgi:C4-type Zn-finger protein